MCASSSQAAAPSAANATLAARLERLYARRAFGMKPGLETTRALLAELDNPQESFRIIHVAGTNGKGSVSHMLAAVLGQIFPNVGLYTSPHLVRLTERFRINGREMKPEALEPLLDAVEAAGERVERLTGNVPTFFEAVTALCMLWWKQQGVHIAVAETGMGGRLDATNVLHPLVSVITRIGLDHTQYLGPTLEAIAGEKAGIIKPGVPVVIGAMPPEAARVISRAAAAAGAPFVDAAAACSVRTVSRGGAAVPRLCLAPATENEDYGTVSLNLPGAYQRENVATVLAAVECLGSLLGRPFPREAVRRGLESATLPGRFQLLQEDPPVFLDGGHNPDAARAQILALKDRKFARGVRLVVAQCADKDSAAYLRVLHGVSDAIWTVPLQNPRGRTPEALADIARAAGFRRAVPCASVAEGIRLATADAADAKAAVLICGSLFLCGEVLAENERPQLSEQLEPDASATP